MQDVPEDMKKYKSLFVYREYPPNRLRNFYRDEMATKRQTPEEVLKTAWNDFLADNPSGLTFKQFLDDRLAFLDWERVNAKTYPNYDRETGMLDYRAEQQTKKASTPEKDTLEETTEFKSLPGTGGKTRRRKTKTSRRRKTRARRTV
jgi:hypothetical protein